MDSIFALSSGTPPGGIAVLRVSGPHCRTVVEQIAGRLPQPRQAVLCRLRHPVDKREIDHGLVLWFAAPASFNGDDCAEFHVHGGAAVIEAMLEAIGAIEGLRLARPGEFSRRAFENGKLDLAELEGLADLVAAETEAQRCQALLLSEGHFSGLINGWRGRLIAIRAGLEAGFDFSDQEDVPADAGTDARARIVEIAEEIRGLLDDGNRGEIVRSGFQVVVMGAPNSGKSSLVNALARRDVAIVSPIAGTTRDLIEVSLDLSGHRIVLVDTAGLRQRAGSIEQQGIDRALSRLKRADLVVWLQEAGSTGEGCPQFEAPVLKVVSKDDAGVVAGGSVSVNRAGGLDWLIAALVEKAAGGGRQGEGVVVTRQRHRSHLERCGLLLVEAADEAPAELRADMLRRASDEIGMITGAIGVEDLLDRIFAEFCIGK